MLSGAFQQNQHTKSTQGQLCTDLYENRTMKSILVDAMLKYRGWTAMSSYMSRSTSENAITINPDNSLQSNYVFVGEGFDYQLSYIFKSNYEIIGRYSSQNIWKDIKALALDSKQYSLGHTKYIWEHTFKLQSELTFDELSYSDGSNKNSWYVRL